MEGAADGERGIAANGGGAIPGFSYPVIGFLRNGKLTSFRSDGDFAVCHAYELAGNRLEGMLLVDDAGRAWHVPAVAVLGRAGSFWHRLRDGVLRLPRYRVRYTFTEAPPVTFDRVQERICASIELHPDDLRQDEVIAGEAAPPRRERSLLDELKAEVRRARSLKELIES